MKKRISVLRKIVATSISVIVIGLSVVGAYVVYLLYFTENVHQELTSGSIENIAVGSSKQSVRNSLSKFSLDYSRKDFRQIEFINKPEESEFGTNFINYKKSLFPEVDGSLFETNGTWVLYFCESSCDWRKNNQWVSFNFEDSSLNKIIIFERKVPELP